MPRLGFLCLLALCSLATPRVRAELTAQEFFEKDVRPLLVERCFSCHGQEKVKGGLRLTSRDALLRGGDSGPAAVEGRPDESLIVQAIRYEDEPRMPPKQKLAEREVATLVRWVELGLPWPEARVEAAVPRRTDERITAAARSFWSFQPVKAAPPPPVVDASWPASGIDRYILAALEARGLKPSPAADRRTLIRRATFDLTGLPPTPGEVESFLADRGEGAYARVIDRLLASPQYGVRWGRHWLDVVRYADARDARGLGPKGDLAEAWRYRDWVVGAFNRDQPFDQFVIDQIAGDLLPAADPDPGAVNAAGLVATGLLAIGEWGIGDADKEKMMTDIADDQIDVVGRAFLGLTLACARCHDHKFDPIPTEDYYGLAGIFLSTHILPDPGKKTEGSPLLQTPIAPRAAIEAVNRHTSRLAELETHLKTQTEAAYAALARSHLPETARYLLAAWNWQTRSSAEGSEARAAFATERGLSDDFLGRWIAYLGLGGDGRLLTQSLLRVAGVSGVFSWRGGADGPSLTVNSTGQAVTIKTLTLPPRSVAVHPGPASSVAVTWKSPFTGNVRIAGKLADADPVAGDGVAWMVTHRRGAVARTLARGDLKNGAAQPIDAGSAAKSLLAIPVSAGDVIRLIVLPKKTHICDTTTVTLAIHAADGSASWDLTTDFLASPDAEGKANSPVGRLASWSINELDGLASLDPGAARLVLLDAWDRALAAEDRLALESEAASLQQAIDEGTAGALVAELISLRGPFRNTPREDLADLPAETRAALTVVRQELDALKKDPPPPIPLALAAQEGGVPNSPHAGFHDARVHIRGSYRRLGATVPRHFPRVLAGDDSPGITRGSGRLELARWIARPEHPLTARVMVNRIWQYHFGAGIVRTPSNFGKLGERPSHPELLDALAAQFVRSGWSIKAMHRAIMLSSTYQQSSRAFAATLAADPENRLVGRVERRRLESEAVRDSLLAAAGRLESTLGGRATQDFASPRRTLYQMTIRSDRSSFGPLFDAADSTAMVDRRTVSTVAPQALFLLNNPLVLDAARDFARRIQAERPGDARAQIERAYALLFSRPPTTAEVEIGLRVLATGDETAWVAYGQVLLCTNEMIYID
jgi:hypothetical protein